MSEKKPVLVFMGTPDFAVAQLDALHKAGYPIAGVVTVPDKPAGRGKKMSESPVKKYAITHNLHLMQPEKLRSESFIRELKELKADIFVVVAFRMIPEVVWSIPLLGTFNLHASLLPQYRGAAPINWAIINGEKETGLTTFFINNHIDEGGILFKESLRIEDTDNAGSLHDKLMEQGKTLVLKTVQAIAQGKATPVSQLLCKEEELKSAPKLYKQDGLIFWNKPGIEIIRKIKGLSPFPAAYAVFKKNNNEEVSLKIYDAQFEPDENVEFGKLLVEKTILKISAKDGYIIPSDVQLSGRNRMSMADFLRGNPTINEWKLVS